MYIFLPCLTFGQYFLRLQQLHQKHMKSWDIVKLNQFSDKNIYLGVMFDGDFIGK